MKQMSVTEKFINILERICISIAAIMLAIAATSSLIQVISRSIIGRPLTWTEELARFAGILMVMFAIGPVFKERGHVGVDFFYNKLPKGFRKYIDVVNDLFTIAVMVLFTYYAVILMENGAKMMSAALRIPMSYVYVGVVIGGGFSSIFAFYAAVKHTREVFSNKCGEEVK